MAAADLFVQLPFSHRCIQDLPLKLSIQTLLQHVASAITKIKLPQCSHISVANIFILDNDTKSIELQYLMISYIVFCDILIIVINYCSQLSYCEIALNISLLMIINITSHWCLITAFFDGLADTKLEVAHYNTCLLYVCVYLFAFSKR